MKFREFLYEKSFMDKMRLLGKNLFHEIQKGDMVRVFVNKDEHRYMKAPKKEFYGKVLDLGELKKTGKMDVKVKSKKGKVRIFEIWPEDIKIVE